MTDVLFYETVPARHFYIVLNADKTYAGVPCATEEEAVEIAWQAEGRRIFMVNQKGCEVYYKIKKNY